MIKFLLKIFSIWKEEFHQPGRFEPLQQQDWSEFPVDFEVTQL